jgi:hypothetical protein
MDARMAISERLYWQDFQRWYKYNDCRSPERSPERSMKSHSDLEALLVIEEMVEVIGVFAHIDLYPVHLAIEMVAAVISGDAATGFEANIEGFVS